MANHGPVVYGLEVPGARLHYEIQGAGPLLVVVGLPMGCKGFAPISRPLAEHFTVVTFDPRGVHSSPADDPNQDALPEVMADDVHRLISALDAGPAYLFASSGGGVTALALAAQHPDQVRTLVAHEPPLLELLTDRVELRAAIDEICDMYRENRPAALQKYLALADIRLHRPTPDPPGPNAFTAPWDVWTILDRLFRFTLRPTTRYRPDIDALRPVADRIVVAGGSKAQGSLFHRTAVALADQLGTELVDFPGDHTGFLTDSEPFARLLFEVFTKARSHNGP
ncbi:alpha/beta fold hydrolase [Streptomyces rishiriensis]|uniref:alpha/beta fold hydrolase n=1 Tax=Streptomyces rishiriensis TaxID=68264 RepID=UPI0037AE4E79